MKKIVAISMVLFWTVIVALLVAGRLHYQQGKESKALSLAGVQGPAAPSSAMPLSAELVAQHGVPADCWIIINNKVYNVSAFLQEHPGGSATITPYCGKDATQAYATKDKNPGQDHTAAAQAMLASYLIGEIGKAPAAQPTEQAVQAQAAGTVLTLAEIAKHNSITDCWLILSGKVYDVTNYMGNHPGGNAAITRYCGTDGTTAFATKDKSPGSGHSAAASSMHIGYYIGDVNQAAAAPVNQSHPANPPNAASGGDDDEYDDD